MDSRIKVTRQSIKKAFIEIRSRKELDKITIKELAENAGISKQTFYLHYNDIYDLSNQTEDELILELVNNISAPDLVIDRIGQATIEMFQRATSQGPIYKIVFSGSRLNTLIDKLEIAFKDVVYTYYPALRTNLRVNVYLSVLLQGCYHAYKEYSVVNQEKVIEILGNITDSLTKEFMRDFKA